MSAFLKVLQKHQAEIDRMIEEQQHGKTMTYSMMQSMGMLKPFAVRLPIPLIAVLDEVASHGLWRSKQEMVYDMIQSAVQDFLSASTEETRKKCLDIQKKALDSWNSKQAAASGTHAPKDRTSTRRAKSGRGKK